MRESIKVTCVVVLMAAMMATAGAWAAAPDAITWAFRIGAATSMIVLSSPATAKVALPADVAEEIPDDLEPEIKTLWQLGDPPLEKGSY